MGCSTCSTTTTDSTPGGCQSNGTCGTSGCNKLNVYNWLADMVLPQGQKPFDIVEIRFNGSRKEFFRNINNLELKVGEFVAVEGNPGHDIGEVSLAGELVRFQLRKEDVKEDSAEIKLLYRHAKQADLEKWQEVKDLEHKTMHRSRTLALELGLKMKLSDVEFQGDGKKATFYYTADERVDFRELIKKLADEFKVRIEMRQIGKRQEASRLGGIGSCGRELCCSTWLTDFKIVSTSAARYQNLSLNPLKLAGQCGKLKCCLNYELDTYMDAIKDIPESNVKLLTGKGTMVHRKTDIFKRIMWYNIIPEPKEGEERTFFAAESWIPMAVDRVKEIVAMNKLNERPDDFGSLDLEEEEDEHDFKDVVGQDSLTRMDQKKKKKKKKGGDNSERPNQGNRPAPVTGNTASANPQGDRPQGTPRPARQASPQQPRAQQTSPQNNSTDQNPKQGNQSAPRKNPNQSVNPNQNKNQGNRLQPTKPEDQSTQSEPLKVNPTPRPNVQENRSEQAPSNRPPRQSISNPNANQENAMQPSAPVAPRPVAPEQAAPAPMQQAPPSAPYVAPTTTPSTRPPRQRPGASE